jgi:hypothetical protein
MGVVKLNDAQMQMESDVPFKMVVSAVTVR